MANRTSISEIEQLSAASNADLLIVSHLSGESYVSRSLSAGVVITAAADAAYEKAKNDLSDDGYLTAHQSLSDYYTKTEVNGISSLLSNTVSSDYAKVEDIYYRFNTPTSQDGVIHLADRAINNVTLTLQSTTLALPEVPTGCNHAMDFVVDMINGYKLNDVSTSASFTLQGTLGEDYNLIIQEDDDWSEMSILQPGEMAQFYFTLTTFAIDEVPTWCVIKKIMVPYVLVTI